MNFGRLGMTILLLLVILGLIIGAITVGGQVPGVSILDKPLHELREGWMVDSDQGWVPIEVGGRSAGGDLDPAVFRVTLPTDLIDLRSLIFRNPFQNVQISIDGQPIFTYGYEDSQKLRIPTGGYLLVSIPPGSQGKELKLQFVSMYRGEPGSLPLITIGQGFTLFARVLMASLFQLMFGIMILMLGLLLSIVGIYVTWKKIPTIGLVYLGVFVQMAGLMTLLATDIPQLVLGHQQFFMACKVSLLMLCVLPFLEFIKRFFKPAKLWLFNLCTILLRLNFLVVVTFVLVTGTVSRFNFIPIHINLLFAITLIFHTLTTNRGEVEIPLRQVLLVGFLLLTAGVLIDMLRFYLFVEVDNTRFFQLGLFLFTIITGMEAINRVIETYRQSIRTQLLEHLAYTDFLTNLPNRTAFERDMEKFAPEPVNCRHCMVVMLDLDHLKEINDKFGHRAGDLALQQCARAIKEIFEEVGGSPYRVGGDEFMVFLPQEAKSQIEELQNKLTTRLQAESASLPYQLVISCGYADGSLLENPNLLTLQEKADEMMYRIKYSSRART